MEVRIDSKARHCAPAGLALIVAAFAAMTSSAQTVDTSASYVLVNRNSGKVVDVFNLATHDGARIAQWTRGDGAWQQWQFVDSGGGHYRLKSRHSGNVPGAGPECRRRLHPPALAHGTDHPNQLDLLGDHGHEYHF